MDDSVRTMAKGCSFNSLCRRCEEVMMGHPSRGSFTLPSLLGVSPARLLRRLPLESQARREPSL